MNQRSLMRGEMVHEGDPSDGGFGMFRTCTLNDGADMDKELHNLGLPLKKPVLVHAYVVWRWHPQ